MEIVAHPPTWVSELLRPKQHILATRGSENGPCLSFSRVLRRKSGRAVLVTVDRERAHSNGENVPLREAVRVDVSQKFLQLSKHDEPAIRSRVLGHPDHSIGTVWGLLRRADRMCDLARIYGASREALARAACAVVRLSADLVESDRRDAYDCLLATERKLRGEISNEELKAAFDAAKCHAERSWRAWPFVYVAETVLGGRDAVRVISGALPDYSRSYDENAAAFQAARAAFVREVTLAEVLLVPSLNKSLK